MFALVSLWQLPDTPRGAPDPPLHLPGAPLVRESPGYLEGYWTYERGNGKCVGFALLDSAQHAHDLRDAIESFMENQEHPAIQLEIIRVHEIMGIAPDEWGRQWQSDLPEAMEASR
jgi:hypothetical protein